MPASDNVLTIPRTGPERAAATSHEEAAPSSFQRVHVPRTKIVGTLGPASSSAEGVRGLIEAGLDVARINFSHGTHEQHARTIATVREVAEQLGRPVAILGDLQGPRIRINGADSAVCTHGIPLGILPSNDSLRIQRMDDALKPGDAT